MRVGRRKVASYVSIVHVELQLKKIEYVARGLKASHEADAAVFMEAWH